MIVETEAYCAGRSGEPLVRRPDAAERDDVRAAGSALRLPLVRDPLVRERRLRRRMAIGAAVLLRALEPTHGVGRDARAARHRTTRGLLASGPGTADAGARHHVRARRARPRAPAVRADRAAATAVDVVASTARRHHARRRKAVALLARRLYVREPSPTTSVTRSPRATATPGSRLWRRTAPARPGRRLGAKLEPSGARLRVARRRCSSRRSWGAFRARPSRPRSSPSRARRARPSADPG